MTEELTGWALVSSYTNTYDDDTEAANHLLTDLEVSARARSALFMLIVGACQHRRRAETVTVERAARKTLRRTLGVTHDTIQARKQLAEEFFALGDGRRVRWGEATVEEHRQRIEMLERMRAGLADTVALHAEAIAAIEAAGVVCLDEIEREVAA